MKYRNREAAGQRLAKSLAGFAGDSSVIVLGLPRGGVPVAAEIAAVLHAPLDVIIVRKLGMPGHAELALGAIASGNMTVFNDDILQGMPVPQTVIDRILQSERIELKHRETAWRGAVPFPPITGKTVILVDDGIATGATMRAAIQAVRTQGPARLVVAVPVAALSVCQTLEKLADQLVCPERPEMLQAVGRWYEDFAQTEDSHVIELLEKSRKSVKSHNA